MAIEESTVESWQHLNELLYADSFHKGIRRFRSPFVFRGLADAEWPLSTTLIRLDGSYELLEGSLLRNFLKYGSSHSDATPSLWRLLSVAQHHGLPTRLLDWTWSPFVAAHFATAETQYYDRPSVIWAIHLGHVRSMLPRRMHEVLEKHYAVAFTVEMLDEVVPDLETLNTLGDWPFAIFFEPPSLDARIVNQFGLFSVLTNPTLTMNVWLDYAKEVLVRRIVIPTELLWEVRDKLDQANVSERMLFPGLDGLAAMLKRHYGPGPAGRVATMLQPPGDPGSSSDSGDAAPAS